jgi:hypothetical protein
MADHNRISAVLSDADIAEIEGHLDAIRAKLPFLITLTTQQRRELAKMGEKSIGFEEKCEAYMQSHPQFLPGYISLEEILKDRQLRTQLLRISPKAESYVNALDDTLMLTNSELWKADLAYYKSVQEAAKRGIADAEAIAADLSSRFTGGPRPTTPPPAAPAS